MSHVLWHDLECGSYAEDLPLWHELAGTAPGPVLDVGAGRFDPAEARRLLPAVEVHELAHA